MHGIDGPTAAPALPSPAAVVGTPGYWSSGDPTTSTPATVPTQDWFNTVQEELVGLVTAAGLAPDKSNHSQLLAALRVLFVAQGGVGGGVTIGANQATIPIAGGFIIKVGTDTGTFSEGALTVTFDNPFPNACWALIPVSINAAGANTKDIWPQRQSRSAGSVTLFMNLGGGGTTNSIDGVDFIAIGT